MKIKALLFVIFTIFLFSLGVLITTLFNSAPTAPDAVAMFYVSLFLTVFGLIFYILFIAFRLYTRIAPGPSMVKMILLWTLITDIFSVALLALKANNVLNWATSLVMIVFFVTLGVASRYRAGT